MANRKPESWLIKALRVLVILIFICSAAWLAYYMLDDYRSKSSLGKLSSGLLAALDSKGEQTAPSTAANTPSADTAGQDSFISLPPQEAITSSSAAKQQAPSRAPLSSLTPAPQLSEGTKQDLSSVIAAASSPAPAADPLPHPLSSYLSSLAQRNKDLAGWIRIEDTIVNYPVMYTPEELEKYLHRNFEGQYSLAGLPFLDTAYPPDSQKVNQIIYAHNMKSGQMFAILNEYLKDDFWAEYRTLSFYTLSTHRDYEVLALIPLVLGPMDDPKMMIFQPLTTDNEQSVAEINSYLMSYARRLDGQVQLGDDLLTLVTCRHARDSDRLILVARKIRADL